MVETGILCDYLTGLGIFYYTYNQRSKASPSFRNLLRNNCYFSFYYIEYKYHRKTYEVLNLRLGEIRVLCHEPILRNMINL